MLCGAANAGFGGGAEALPAVQKGTASELRAERRGDESGAHQRQLAKRATSVLAAATAGGNARNFEAGPDPVKTARCPRAQPAGPGARRAAERDVTSLTPCARGNFEPERRLLE